MPEAALLCDAGIRGLLAFGAAKFPPGNSRRKFSAEIRPGTGRSVNSVRDTVVKMCFVCKFEARFTAAGKIFRVRHKFRVRAGSAYAGDFIQCRVGARLFV